LYAAHITRFDTCRALPALRYGFYYPVTADSRYRSPYVYVFPFVYRCRLRTDTHCRVAVVTLRVHADALTFRFVPYLLRVTVTFVLPLPGSAGYVVRLLLPVYIVHVTLFLDATLLPVTAFHVLVYRLPGVHRYYHRLVTALICGYRI